MQLLTCRSPPDLTHGMHCRLTSGDPSLAAGLASIFVERSGLSLVLSLVVPSQCYQWRRCCAVVARAAMRALLLVASTVKKGYWPYRSCELQRRSM